MNSTAIPRADLGTETTEPSNITEPSNVVSLTSRKGESPHNPNWEWQTDAACRGSDTNAYYAESLRGNTRIRQEEAAKRVCAGCPVLANCLRWALKTEEPYGIWGGLNPEERQEILEGTRTA